MPTHNANRGRLTLVACGSGQAFAERVAFALNLIMRKESGVPFRGIAKSSEVFFSNGEVKTMINESVRGDDVYVIQCIDDPTSPLSVNDNLIAMLTAINAAKQADADRITAVLPQFPYARQERKKGRESVTAKQVARFLEVSGADRVISLDIHAEAIGGFFHTAVMDDLHASQDLLQTFQTEVLKGNDPQDFVVVSPDVGSAERARYYSHKLGCHMAICDKERDYSRPGTVKKVRLVGDVRNKDVFMVDDIIDTGGSILEAAATCKREGARRLFLAATLPYLTGPAIERMQAAYELGHFDMLFGTDAVMRAPDWIEEMPWYHEVSVAPLFARVLYNVNRKRSVSRLLQ